MPRAETRRLKLSRLPEHDAKSKAELSTGRCGGFAAKLRGNHAKNHVLRQNAVSRFAG